VDTDSDTILWIVRRHSPSLVGDGPFTTIIRRVEMCALIVRKSLKYSKDDKVN